MIFAIIQLLFICISPFLYFCLGKFVISNGQAILSRLLRKNFDNAEYPVVCVAVFGLLFYLLSSFAFFSIGLPLRVSACLPFIPAILASSDISIKLQLSKFRPSVNFALWFAVITALSLSLFNAVSDITTPWANNYGDLTFHIGMITSFVFGENNIPQYHIFPGQILSYHFMINFWSACLWWIYPSLTSLSMIFAFQWILVWIVVYITLSGDRFRVIPWAVLFAGGSYQYLFNSIQTLIAGGSDKWAHEFLRSGLPWTPLISTIWVPQRPSLLGLLVLLPSLQLFHMFLKSERQRSLLVLSAVTISFMPLAHSTFFLAAVLYLSAVLVFRVISRIRIRAVPGVDSYFPASLNDLLIFIGCLLPALLSIPWLIGKGGVVSFSAGWMPWPRATELSAALFNTLSMWLDNAALWLLLMVLICSFCRNRLCIVSVIVLFLAGNFFQIGVWDWDQIKYFIAVYLITLTIAAHFEMQHRNLLSLILLLTTLPAIYETGKVIINYRDHVVYTKDDIRIAEQVRENTEPTAVIASSSKHNSLVTLTGRLIFSGYGGTLGSHGIAYLARQNFSKDLNKIVHCQLNASYALPGIGLCPQYVLWTKPEQELWKGAQAVLDSQLIPVVDKVLYEIP